MSRLQWQHDDVIYILCSVAKFLYEPEILLGLIILAACSMSFFIFSFYM